MPCDGQHADRRGQHEDGVAAAPVDDRANGASKAALENYTMSAAAELGSAGVTANIVYPPITDTGWVTDDVRSFAQARGLRVAKASQVAEVVGWLCTDAGALVTGNRIRLR